MEELTVEEALEKYPMYKDYQDRYIFITKKEMDELENGDKVKIAGYDMPIQYLVNILKDEKYFNIAFNFFTGQVNTFGVTYIIYGDFGNTLHFEKSIILRGLTELVKRGMVDLTDEEKKRYEALSDAISYDKFIEKYAKGDYTISVDGNEYTLPVKELIAIMHTPYEEFRDLCSNLEIKEIRGIPKEHFIYAAYKFFKDNSVLKNYAFEDVVFKRFIDVGQVRTIDLQAINKHLVTKDTMFEKVQVDKELESAILDGMPSDLSTLEKAIYVYLKMCKLLTYDEEYYALNQQGVAKAKHADLSYVSTINLTNNKVVCFEFNMIYSKLLNDLGIKFASDYKNMIGEAYGDGHANLEFRVDKFLVKADSVTSILQGDIMQAKLNQPLVGLTCINKNAQTQQEFRDAITKIYKILAPEKEVEHIETLEELLKEYEKVTTNIEEIDLDQRLNILLDKIKESGLVGIDSLSYVLQLRKILFTDVMRENNIKVTILRDNEAAGDGRVATASAIFAINKDDFSNQDGTIYYYFNPQSGFLTISYEELQEKFNGGAFEYIAKDDPRIPGIDNGGGIKK